MAKKKKACKPQKGKASAKRVDGKCVSYGKKGVTPSKPGSKRQKAFCARHKNNNGPAGKLAKKRWGC